MYITEELQAVAKLGSDLAQTHYATTTDLDGPLPMLPTDADLQRLNDRLERAPSLEERREFENGYRESMHRLHGDANSTRPNAVMLHEFAALLGRYGYTVPQHGSLARERFESVVAHFLVDLRTELDETEPALTK